MPEHYLLSDKFQFGGGDDMKQISNKEYEEFQQYKSDRAFGKILTPDGLRFIIEANDYDARKIGQHFLDMLPKIRDWTKKEYE